MMNDFVSNLKSHFDYNGNIDNEQAMLNFLKTNSQAANKNDLNDALRFICEIGNSFVVKEIIEILLSAGADVHCEDLLIKAAKNSNGGADAMEILIAKGANPNQKWEYFETTPLMHAAQRANWWACEVLLKNGADINATDTNGKNAYTHAMEFRKSETARLLVQHGANPIMVR